MDIETKEKSQITDVGRTTILGVRDLVTGSAVVIEIKVEWQIIIADGGK